MRAPRAASQRVLATRGEDHSLLVAVVTFLRRLMTPLQTLRRFGRLIFLCTIVLVGGRLRHAQPVTGSVVDAAKLGPDRISTLYKK